MNQHRRRLATLLLLAGVLLLVSRVVDAQEDNFTDAYIRGSAAFHRGLAMTDSSGQRVAFKEALQAWNEAVEANPHDQSALLNRGAISYELGDYETAIGDATRVLELMPDSQFALQNRAAAYRAMGDFEAAYADYKQAYDFCIMADGCVEISPYRFQVIEGGMKETKVLIEDGY